ncbi:MAG: ATP-binding protein [Spirochaetes bacterium]|nr:ATP-binding protein [Spirochaetota bacterium]
MQDISLHILDIVENSTMAGASLVEITIEEDPGRDLLTLTIQDNGKGMNGGLLLTSRDPFTTTRTTRRVGMGIPLLDEAARQAGGGLEIRSEPGKGTFLCARFIASHIDRKPLGDLGSTVVTLIMGNPGVDFIVRRITGGESVELDTREIKAGLEDVSITSPAVLNRIKELFRD